MGRGGSNTRLSSQPWKVEEGRTPGPTPARATK